MGRLAVCTYLDTVVTLNVQIGREKKVSKKDRKEKKNVIVEFRRQKKMAAFSSSRKIRFSDLPGYVNS